MKRFVAIALIFLMSAQSMYKLGLVTYFQLNRSYIATELCVNKDNPITMCYGKCFLDRNMKLVTETEKQKQEVPTGKHKLEIPVFMLSQISYTLTPAGAHLSESCTEYCDTIPTDFTAAIFHPPALS